VPASGLLVLSLHPLLNSLAIKQTKVEKNIWHAKTVCKFKPQEFPFHAGKKNCLRVESSLNSFFFIIKKPFDLIQSALDKRHL
jgi:hypothetical protein